MQDTNTYWYAMSEDTQQPEEQAENTAAPQAESTPDSPETKEPTAEAPRSALKRTRQTKLQ